MVLPEPDKLLDRMINIVAAVSVYTRVPACILRLGVVVKSIDPYPAVSCQSICRMVTASRNSSAYKVGIIAHFISQGGKGTGKSIAVPAPCCQGPKSCFFLPAGLGKVGIIGAIVNISANHIVPASPKLLRLGHGGIGNG